MEMDYVVYYDLQAAVIVAPVVIILKHEISIVDMKLQSKIWM
jgi:ABC-type dipeptide/oligopeptide/nickel transport system ATPase subunit